MHKSLDAAITEVADQFRYSVQALDGYPGSIAATDILLKANGGVMLGAGCFGAAVYLDILGKAVKLCNHSDIWVQYALWCQRNPTAEFAIEVHYLEVNEELGYAFCVMPRYQTVDAANANGCHESRALIHGLRGDYGYYASPAQQALRRFSYMINASWDLHDQNVAFDRGERYGRVVLLDPWTGDGTSEQAVHQLKLAHESNTKFRWFKKVEHVQPEPLPPIEARPVDPRPALWTLAARLSVKTRKQPRTPLFQVWAYGKRIVAVGIKDCDRLVAVKREDIKPWPGSPAEFNRAVAGLPTQRVDLVGPLRPWSPIQRKQSNLMVGHLTAYRVPNRECERRLGWMGREALLGERHKSEVAHVKGRRADLLVLDEAVKLASVVRGRSIVPKIKSFRFKIGSRFVRNEVKPGKVERAIEAGLKPRFNYLGIDLARPGPRWPEIDYAAIERNVLAHAGRKLELEMFVSMYGACPPFIARPEVLQRPGNPGDN